MEIPFGWKMTARKLVDAIRKIIVSWRYDAITIGYPGAVLYEHIVSDSEETNDSE